MATGDQFPCQRQSYHKSGANLRHQSSKRDGAHQSCKKAEEIETASLNQAVEKYPDKTLKPRAQEFGVVPSPLSSQLQRRNITRKNSFGIQKETMQREYSLIDGWAKRGKASA
ncbi:IS630 transposase-related protein [Gloeomargarita sp.]